MEGLIPMVYKALKRSKTRRQYKCLSIGAAQTYNISDFYPSNTTTESADQYQNRRYMTPPPEYRKVEEDGGAHPSYHRRYKSMGAGGHEVELSSAAGFSTTFFSPDGKISTIKTDDDLQGAQPHLTKHIPSFRRSHRGMFSCVTGS